MSNGIPEHIEPIYRDPSTGKKIDTGPKNRRSDTHDVGLDSIKRRLHSARLIEEATRARVHRNDADQLDTTKHLLLALQMRYDALIMALSMTNVLVENVFNDPALRRITT